MSRAFLGAMATEHGERVRAVLAEPATRSVAGIDMERAREKQRGIEADGG